MCPTRRYVAALAVSALLILYGTTTVSAQQPQPAPVAPIKVFLDCDSCFSDFLRTEVSFVDYVRDRTGTDIHVLVTRAQTGAGGSEYTLAFTGAGRFAGVAETVRAVTTSSDTDDVIRRQLATALRVGLLRYVTRESVPQNLGVTVRLGSDQQRAVPGRDPWDNWVFSLRGSASFSGEETSRERQIGLGASADRITQNWKMTFGAELDHEREKFDLDEDEPVDVERREQEFDWLIVKGLGEHWSVGATGDIESSTFDNMKLSLSASPAIEYNFFPYSAYTRRQLRALYSVGVAKYRYYEETLYGKLEETRPLHAISLTFDQRERWGTLQARVEWSQYLHDLSKSRLEADGEFSVRLARGLSVGAELNASRIRDQLSLPARGATEEEVLLRLRQLQSGYEYSLSASLTYTFGSIFSAIVNPRFGQ